VSAPPDIAVVVASHDRPLRLRWLLNALADQTLPRARFEVVVGHDSSAPATEDLLRTHPLAQEGVLRHVTLPPGSAPPGRNRNAAWRASRAPVVAFTDDDCRPPAQWIERCLEAARRHPGAIVQGATRPDPEEQPILEHAPWVLTRSIRPPRPWAQACNIVYPREVLEALGGFPEDMFVGEDTSLAERARSEGVPYVGAPEVENWHAVEDLTLLGMARASWKWSGLPLLIRRHPRLRREFPMWMFWRREHVWLPFAVAGWLYTPRTRLAALMALPYLAHATPNHGPFPRGRMRSALELPGRVAIDLAEFLALAWGSLRHRTPFL
jgi:GT2 family glycosyltransferase